MRSILAFLAPGRIGRLTLKNRLIRAATSETMATPEGSPTEPLVTLYRDLAAGGAGLIITGHIFVEARGQYEPRQLGLHRDAHIPTYARVTEAVGTHIPITARLGVQDAVEEGLTLQEGLERASQLAALGLDAIELTYGIMSSYRQNIHPYAGNTRWHELADGIVHRLLAARVPEAYYRPFAKRLKQVVPIPVILVGGLRSTAIMDDVIRSGDADFVALARPFVRQPDLPNRIIAGQRGALDCVSCNLCFKHEGLDPLRCWRTPKIRLLSHLFSRVIAGLPPVMSRCGPTIEAPRGTRP